MPVRTRNETEVAELSVVQWSGSGQVVLALAGLGGSGPSWDILADALPDARVIAPSLRGRGKSFGLTGPTGLKAHAKDVLRIAEELELRDIVVVGHSYGAYLTPLVARELGSRVSRVVMLDGGIPPKLPALLKRPKLVKMKFRKDLTKAQRDYSSVEEVFEAARFADMLKTVPEHVPRVMEWVREDLVGEPGKLRIPADVDRLSEDAVDAFFGPDVVPALKALTVPAHLIVATHGVSDKAKPFISDKAIAELAPFLPTLTTERLEANHVTLLFRPEVSKAVAG